MSASFLGLNVSTLIKFERLDNALYPGKNVSKFTYFQLRIFRKYNLLQCPLASRKTLYSYNYGYDSWFNVFLIFHYLQILPLSYRIASLGTRVTLRLHQCKRQTKNNDITKTNHNEIIAFILHKAYWTKHGRVDLCKIAIDWAVLTANKVL